MSGHSKWATTKRQKGLKDAKRAGAFTKSARVITIAAREGGDPVFNSKLRMAIERAKDAGMPKDNIEKAIKKGTGELGDGVVIEELFYEGYGPDGSACIVQTLTDNRNRTNSELKHLFDDRGGSLGIPNSVAWMFNKVGGIKAELDNKAKDDIELLVIESGADDFEWLDEKTVFVYTKVEELAKTKDALEKNGFKILDSEIGYKPKDALPPANEESRKRIEGFYEALDEHDDVQNFWSNILI